MNYVARFFRKMWILVHREKFRDELAEEMAFHREHAEQEFQTDGMPGEAARYAARRQFGNAAQTLEQSHDVVSFGFETALQDFRFAIWQLRKNPGFAATAILVLALGIGASVAIFAFVDAALLKPLPYQNPSRLVGVYERVGMIPRSREKSGIAPDFCCIRAKVRKPPLVFASARVSFRLSEYLPRLVVISIPVRIRRARSEP